MDISKLSLDKQQKETVETILADDDMELEEKLMNLMSLQLDSNIYEKIKANLKKKDEEEKEKQKQKDASDFIPLMEKSKHSLMNFYLKRKKYDVIAKEVAKASEACQQAFREFMKRKDLKIPAMAATPKNVVQPATESEEEEEKEDEEEKEEEDEEEKEEEDEEEKEEEEKEEEDDEKNRTVLDSTDSEESAEEPEPAAEEPQWKPKVDSGFFKKFPDCLNILVLGETGVGKSTFLNGLANYLKHSNMHEAKDNGVEILIKSHFTHMDGDYNQMRIECEPTIKIEEENENTADGQSSTQSPKAYQFEWGPRGNRKTIRLIDTPGVNDVRGLEQEQLNFAKILSFIADYPEIHAILILLKPNTSRLHLAFRYCVNELLTHLHISASKNIIFCFTNARGTLYKPGDTLGPLQILLNNLHQQRGVRIPLNSDTTYCFDNESFRFLCAWKQGATFDEKQIEDFNKSWKITVTETFRLFKKIAELPTHKTEETLSINNIRSVILAMARPLAEIAKNQMTNAKLIDDKVKEVEDLIDQGKGLANVNLYVDQVKLNPKELGYPVTVCTNEGCVEIIKLSGSVYETYYKQKCHPHCYLTGIQTGLVPNPQIKNCACFFGTGTNKCKVCSCSWETHLHIRYELTKSVQKITNPTVKDSIKNCDDKIKTAQLFIEAEKKRKLALETEAKTIAGHCAEFAAFLKKHSIIPYNDVYKEYVEHLIREENGKVSQGASKQMLLQLQKYRDQYAQQVNILESHGTATTSTKSIGEIYGMLEQLKQMKNCGALLREIEELEMLAVRKEQANQVTHVDIKQGWLDQIHEGGRSAVRPSSSTTSQQGQKPKSAGGKMRNSKR